MRSKLTDTVTASLDFFRSGKPVDEIATIRGVKASTVYSHLAVALECGEKIELDALLSDEARKEIRSALRQHGFVSLSPAYNALAEKYDYGLLKLVRAEMQALENAGDNSPGIAQ